MNDQDILDRVPVAARQAMDDLLARIAANLTDPGWNSTRDRQSALGREVDALQDAATELFAKSFLPLVVRGEWRRSAISWPHPPYGDAGMSRVMDHMQVFRRKGAKGPFSAANSVVVTMPYMKAPALAAVHGRTAEFSIGFDDRRHCTLEADCRLSELAWHFPGETRLVVLADPGLLAAGRAMHAVAA